jgi:hypothetical protein
VNTDQCDICRKPLDMSKDSMVHNEDTGALCCADCFAAAALEVLEAIHVRASKN